MKIIKKILFFFPIIILTILILIKFEIIDFHNNLNTIYNDMRYQNLNKPQRQTKYFEFNIRIINDSIIPNNDNFYYLDPTEFEIAEKSDLFEKLDTLSIENGKKLYFTHCSICHDSSGKGSGWIVTKVQLDSNEEGFPKPQDLTREITKKFSDRRLFHILSTGQNLMFSVSQKLNNNQKLEIMNYIHFLQNK